MKHPAPPQDVAKTIASYPREVRDGVQTLRALIFDVACTHSKDIVVIESLKWGQPAYRPAKGGTTLRAAPHPDACFALFAHCQTTLIGDYAAAFPGWDRIDGTRAVLFDNARAIEPLRLTHLIRSALTYHRRAAA